jgi:hypothetical protein
MGIYYDIKEIKQMGSQVALQQTKNAENRILEVLDRTIILKISCSASFGCYDKCLQPK